MFCELIKSWEAKAFFMVFLPVVEGVFPVDDVFFDRYSVSSALFVVGCVFDKEGGCLFVKNAKRDFGWEFVGGKAEEGEKPVDCLKREVFEEVGLAVLNVRHVAFVVDHFKAPKGSFTLKGFAFYAECKDSVLTLDSKEIKEAGFFKDLPGKMAWNDGEIFEVAKKFRESL